MQQEYPLSISQGGSLTKGIIPAANSERNNTMTNKPKLPIASPQRGDEPGTWAYKTVSSRFTKTAQRILVENNFPLTLQTRLEALIAEIPNAGIRPINDLKAHDSDHWQTYVKPYIGQNWHRPPWFFTEHYFYRRILEATRYFQSGEGNGVDPFSYQKRKGLEVSRTSIHDLTNGLASWSENGHDRSEILEKLFYLDLWGNQADLSLWPAEGDDKPDHPDLNQALTHILVNQVESVTGNLLKTIPHSRIDFLVDNAGFELVSDLVFSDYLLTSGIASAIRLHVKPHPTYVSDAMEKDIRATIEFLRADQHKPTRDVGERLRDVIKTNQLQIKSNWFWTSPLEGWLMPDALKDELAQAGLVISKGDANYRRLLGDRHWPFITSFEDIVAYFPTALVALRTMKSELVVGLDDGQAQETSARDPEWLINGRWGMVQYFSGSQGNGAETQ
jgi:uncharacterized protein with ATP-grasp and redox domains